MKGHVCGRKYNQLGPTASCNVSSSSNQIEVKQLGPIMCQLITPAASGAHGELWGWITYLKMNHMVFLSLSSISRYNITKGYLKIC